MAKAKPVKRKFPVVKVDMPALLDKLKKRGGTPGLVQINVAEQRALSAAAAAAYKKDKLDDEGQRELVEAYCKGADGLEGTHPKRAVYLQQDQAYQISCMIEGVPEGSHNRPPEEDPPENDPPEEDKKTGGRSANGAK